MFSSIKKLNATPFIQITRGFIVKYKLDQQPSVYEIPSGCPSEWGYATAAMPPPSIESWWYWWPHTWAGQLQGWSRVGSAPANPRQGELGSMRCSNFIFYQKEEGANWMKGRVTMQLKAFVDENKAMDSTAWYREGSTRDVPLAPATLATSPRCKWTRRPFKKRIRATGASNSVN